MRELLITLVAFSFLAACETDKVPEPSPSPDMHSLHGKFDATGDCIAEKHGFPIEIEDEDGSVIATGTTTPDADRKNGRCVSTFRVEVPDVSAYTIRMGPWQGPTYSNAQLSANNWTLALSITE